MLLLLFILHRSYSCKQCLLQSLFCYHLVTVYIVCVIGEYVLSRWLAFRQNVREGKVQFTWDKGTEGSRKLQWTQLRKRFVWLSKPRKKCLVSTVSKIALLVRTFHPSDQTLSCYKALNIQQIVITLHSFKKCLTTVVIKIKCYLRNSHSNLIIINFPLYIVQPVTVGPHYMTVCYLGPFVTSPVELMLPLVTPWHLCWTAYGRVRLSVFSETLYTGTHR